MGLTVRSLVAKSLSSAGTSSASYQPGEGKGAIVKSIVIVNTNGSGASTVSVELITSAGTVKICPGAISIAQGAMLTLDAEITLSWVNSTTDKITVTCNSGSVDCVVSPGFAVWECRKL